MKHIVPLSLALLVGAGAAHAADTACKEARRGLSARANVSCGRAREVVSVAHEAPSAEAAEHD